MNAINVETYGNCYNFMVTTFCELISSIFLPHCLPFNPKQLYKNKKNKFDFTSHVLGAIIKNSLPS